MSFSTPTSLTRTQAHTHTHLGRGTCWCCVCCLKIMGVGESISSLLFCWPLVRLMSPSMDDKYQANLGSLLQSFCLWFHRKGIPRGARVRGQGVGDRCMFFLKHYLACSELAFCRCSFLIQFFIFQILFLVFNTFIFHFILVTHVADICCLV